MLPPEADRLLALEGVWGGKAPAHFCFGRFGITISSFLFWAKSDIRITLYFAVFDLETF